MKNLQTDKCSTDIMGPQDIAEIFFYSFVAILFL